MAINTSLTSVDAYGRQTIKRHEGTATTIGQAQADALSLRQRFEAISDLAVVKETLSTDTVISSVASSGANVDVGATIHCRLNNGKIYPLKIPGINLSLINQDGSVKLDDSNIGDYVSLFTQSGPFRVSEGNYVVAALYGELDR